MSVPALQVRRKADPAKEQVREFVGRWRDNPAVTDNVSHDEITGVHSSQFQHQTAAFCACAMATAG
jgi:hypothetical protein